MINHQESLEKQIHDLYLHEIGARLACHGIKVYSTTVLSDQVLTAYSFALERGDRILSYRVDWNFDNLNYPSRRIKQICDSAISEFFPGVLCL